MSAILYNWIFHYNPYTTLWETCKREHYTQLFSGGNDKITSSNINVLIEIVCKTDGDAELINKLTENNDDCPTQ